jgi:pimeloyl-ACP methyl ester carboxylesterase
VPDDFELNGFTDTLRKSAQPADMIIADIHFGYYVRRNLLERLREDLVEPAKSAGYATISLGGLGALLYAMTYPCDVQRLILLAPYLGEPALVNEIAGAGGVKRWDPCESRTDDELRRLWRWLQDCTTSARASPDIYLGFGDGDPFAPGNALLAEVLPAHHVFTVRGRHDWLTWKRLWSLIVAERDARAA